MARAQHSLAPWVEPPWLTGPSEHCSVFLEQQDLRRVGVREGSQLLGHGESQHLPHSWWRRCGGSGVPAGFWTLLCPTLVEVLWWEGGPAGFWPCSWEASGFLFLLLHPLYFNFLCKCKNHLDLFLLFAHTISFLYAYFLVMNSPWGVGFEWEGSPVIFLKQITASVPFKWRPCEVLN